MGFFQNTRKPEGLAGKIMVKMMNAGHSKVAQWGFSNINPKEKAKVLDIGCGGGANIARWLEISKGSQVSGLDYSDVSVEVARKLNKNAIDRNRCQIIQGDVSNMPYKNGIFDYVSAFETIYFWPGLETCFKEVARVLKTGGTFMICNETDGLDNSDEIWTKRIEGMTVYKANQICEALSLAGFQHINVYTKLGKHWLCIVAEKE